MNKLSLQQAVVVEGRDDVRAVQSACEALVIPTHGYGISAETWRAIEKAYKEKGIIIFTDPDHAGREIRKSLAARFPEAIHAHLDREDARDGSDIGIENARPEDIAEAITKALELAGKSAGRGEDGKIYANAIDLAELGLAGSESASKLRADVCRELGIGYCNASAMIKKLRGFGIDKDELTKAVEKIK